jgi:G:T-mismatch repair DNA endonuclease (very short patch repair protein)
MSLPTEIASQWHPTKNTDLVLAKLGDTSKKKAWWVCEFGHEYVMSIASRNLGRGCLYCSGQLPILGVNDLATINPLVASQWHPTKNVLSPVEVSAGSNRKVWWLDEFGHEWETTVHSRVSGNNCPVCTNRVILAGFNDLVTTHPDLAKEFHPTKNVIPLESLSKGSTKKAWWLCEFGHEWEAVVGGRVAGNGCPICSGRSVSFGVNSLAVLRPDLAFEWHPTKNGSLTADMVKAQSNLSVWWMCSKGHEWQAEIYSRFRVSNCPFCSGYKPILGETDLATTHPDLAAQWHPSKNENFYPTQVSRGSDKSVWWVCSKGHEWQAGVYSRVAGNGCGQCWGNTFSSKAELELGDLLVALGFNVSRNDRRTLKGQELDVFIPERMFAVELNGVYWHSEAAGKGKDYHKAKFDAAKSVGIQLVQVWEDDWRDRKPVVVRALAHKLGVTRELAVLFPEFAGSVERISGRKTSVVVVNTGQAKMFLDENHIQGFASGSYYVGLQDSAGVLQALIVLKREAGNVLNIVRYATAGSVMGGFTKLLAYATKTYEPDSFVTFADHTISDGGLYEGSGFVADKLLAPDYMYVVRGERKHKFGYRLKRFREDPLLLWEDGLSERQLALLNKIPRIWDAGKTRYRLDVK